MKIKIVSDLHLEFYGLTLPNNGADVLVLSGDIAVANGRTPDRVYREFFEQIQSDYKHIVYIMGNHEHYSGNILTTTSILRDFLKDYPKVTLLDNEWIDIDGVAFVGTTLWSDINQRNPLSMIAVKDLMNDFHVVHYGDVKYLPEQWIQNHIIALNLVRSTVDNLKDQYESIVICGHHAPSRQSIHENYKHEFHGNGCYASDLDNIIHDFPKNVKLWTHGHVHNNFDYHIGNTRIICNPRGYCNKYQQENKNFDPNLIIEI